MKMRTEEDGMKVMAHRGLWESTDERNSLPALRRAINKGYGIETDIRDYMGRLVISHNIADSASPLLESFFIDYISVGSNVPLALNVKADGIQKELYNLIFKYEINNYFIFDMSVPEMVMYKKNEMNFFTRHSDIEEQCVLYDDAIGVWLDSFYEEEWLKADIIKKHLNDKKAVCIISSEIHGFDEKYMWDMLKKENLESDDIMLCTDKPEEAEAFFNG